MMPMRGGSGEVVGFLKIARDRAEARRAEQALRDLNETLEHRVTERTRELAAETAERAAAEEALRQAQKMQALCQIMGGIAHDFNNLLTIIQASADFLRQPEIAPERRALCRGDRRHGGAGRQPHAAAPRFARKQPLKPEVFDLNARMQSVVGVLARLIGGHFRVELDLALDLWPIEVDPNQRDIVLLNVGVNARDAMSEGGTLTIRTRNVEFPLLAKPYLMHTLAAIVNEHSSGTRPAKRVKD